MQRKKKSSNHHDTQLCKKNRQILALLEKKERFPYVPYVGIDMKVDSFWALWIIAFSIL